MFHFNPYYDTRNVKVNSTLLTNAAHDFFSNRVINFWNRLPFYVKNALSVNAFKANLDHFKTNNYNSPYGFWHISEEVFNRIPDKSAHVNFLISNPDVAVRKNISIGVVGGTIN